MEREPFKLEQGQFFQKDLDVLRKMRKEDPRKGSLAVQLEKVIEENKRLTRKDK